MLRLVLRGSYQQLYKYSSFFVVLVFFSKVWMALGALPFLQKILWAWLAGWFILSKFLSSAKLLAAQL